MATKTTTKKIAEPSLASILAKRGGKYLSDVEKQEFSDRATEFTVSKIVKNKGTFGQRWECAIKAEGKERALTIPSHAARDETMTLLKSLVDKKGAQGPLVLRIREMEDDRTWMSLDVPKKGRGKQVNAPLAFSFTDGKCHMDTDPKEPHRAPVLRANVKGFPETCVVCLIGAVDVPMEWRLSNSAVQILVHREASKRISEEQEEMESRLPEELRPKRKK